ncbi:MAG: hypothetical protein SH850_29425 [Planctomycetaceae bacterium]|nr:hypothetical protein [Planctomycetaceae bacterium]
MKTVTVRGIRDVYLLVFLRMKTREVIVSPLTRPTQGAVDEAGAQ